MRVENNKMDFWECPGSQSYFPNLFEVLRRSEMAFLACPGRLRDIGVPLSSNRTWNSHSSPTTSPFEVKLQRWAFPNVPFLMSPRSSCSVEFWISQFNPGYTMCFLNMRIAYGCSDSMHWVHSLTFYSLNSPSISSGSSLARWLWDFSWKLEPQVCGCGKLPSTKILHISIWSNLLRMTSNHLCYSLIIPPTILYYCS
jgi:hypothetical protein